MSRFTAIGEAGAGVPSSGEQSDAAVITDVGWLVCSIPLAVPVSTSFGRMDERHAVLVTVTLEDGSLGIGESWTNFPAWAPDERVATLRDGIRPLVVGRTVPDVREFTASLTQALAPVARQWGAKGPIYQAISGFDIALWDAMGRRLNRSTASLIGGPEGADGVRVYASGLGPNNAVENAAPAWESGIRILKLKVGFSPETDLANLTELHQAFSGAVIALDANQGWDVEAVGAFAPHIDTHQCAWLEEPVPVDQPKTLRAVVDTAPCTIAAGENAYGVDEYVDLLEAGVGILQPDVTKNGGISAALDVYDLAAQHGVPVIPHLLGGAVGQIASAHLVAARTTDGLFEMDANPNPLRESLLAQRLTVKSGRLQLPPGPGLGISLDADYVQDVLVASSSPDLLEQTISTARM